MVGDEMFGKNSDSIFQPSSSGFPENRREALEESRGVLELAPARIIENRFFTK